MRKGLKVYSNYELKFPYTPVRNIDDVLRMKDGFFAGDELWHWLDCVSNDSVVVTGDDAIPISDVRSGNSVCSVDFDRFSMEKSVSNASTGRVSGFMEDVYEIRSSTNKIECSGNHRFFVWDGNGIVERYASCIKKGDNIMVAEKIPSPNKRLVSPRIAQLIGYIHGDGTVYYNKKDVHWSKRKGAIHISDSDKSLLEKYGKMFGKGVNFSIRKLKGCKCYRLHMCSRAWIENNIISNIPEAVMGKWSVSFSDIPECISKSDNKVLGAYVRGLFDAEACVVFSDCDSKGKQTKIQLAMNEKINMMRLKTLLLRFGIRSSVRDVVYRSKGRRETNGNVLTISDRQSILRFHDYIGFSSEAKKLKLGECVKFIQQRKLNNDKSRVLPVGSLFNRLLENTLKLSGLSRLMFRKRLGVCVFGIGKSLSKRRLSVILSAIQREFGDVDGLSGFLMFVKGDVGFEKVVSVSSKKKTCYLYDLNVPCHENYIANGFVVHNSRVSMSKKNQVVGNFLLTSRKKGVNFAFTAQSFNQIDVRIRKICDFLAMPQLNAQESVCRLIIFTYPSLTPIRTYKFRTQPIFNLYDTNEIIDALPDEDESTDFVHGKAGKNGEEQEDDDKQG